MSSFCPKLYISIGETNAFFTLRETYLYEVWVGGQGGYMHKEVRSFHHFNLSQNPEEAFSKATIHAQNMGLPLDASVENLSQQMRDIKRASAEALEERAKRLKLEMEERIAEKEAYIAERNNKIENGYFTFGPYFGQKFEEAPRGYLSWLMDKIEDFEEGSVLRKTAENVLKLVPHLALPKPISDLHVGTVGKREVYHAEVVKVREFWKDSFSGFGMDRGCVTTFVTDQGACMVCFSGAIYLNEGDKISFKATVKEHTEYNGQSQTVVQRLKVI